MEFLTALFALLGVSSPVTQAITLIPTVIGGASLIVKGAGAIAKITPNTKDDKAVGKIKKGLSKVVGVLDVLALNPDLLDARQPSLKKLRKNQK